MTFDHRPRSITLPFARCAVIAGFLAVLCGCGGGGGGGYDELLFVTDRLAINSYSVSNGTPTLRGSAMIPGIPGTYSRAGNLVTVTMQKHNVPDGYKILLDFSAGAGGTATDGIYAATSVDDDTFTITDIAAGTITNGTVLRSPAVQFGATYSQVGTTVTITLAGHALVVDDTVILDYTSGTAVDDDTLIDTVPDADTFTVVADAPATTSGNVNVTVGGNYAIFGMAMHPNGKWLYVTSIFDCFQGEPYCWAGDMISRFAINWGSGTLTWEASYRTSDDASSVTDGPSPVTLVFSADGTRLFHQDDDLDGLRMWDVDPTDGSLMLIARRPRTRRASTGSRYAPTARASTTGTACSPSGRPRSP